jgi:serine/threonine protein kinase
MAEGHLHGKHLLTPGTEVDNYKVVRLVGRGGMGEVYLARDTVLGRKVALKAVRPKALGDRKSIERFLHEARVTAQFNHPNIVAIYGVGGLAGSLYLALEYLEGQTLRHRMADERPGLKEAIRIGLAIAEALAEAHRHGILHRDLKPGNVVIPRDGRLRVVDFGLAKQVEEVGSRPKPAGVREPADSDEFVLSDLAETHPGGRGPPKGTPGYMAPEQWDKHPCTASTDIWALGVILYELIGGQHPFPDAGLYELCVEVTGPEPMPSLSASRDRPNLPAELSDLVDRCLSKDPSKRPTAETATETLSALLAGGRETRAVPGLASIQRTPCRSFLWSRSGAQRLSGTDAGIPGVAHRGSFGWRQELFRAGRGDSAPAGAGPVDGDPDASRKPALSNPGRTAHIRRQCHRCVRDPGYMGPGVG